MLKSGMYDFVICCGGTDMCFVLGFGRKHSDLKQYRISSLTLHYCYPTRSDLQGGVHLVREHPTEAIRHTEAHPTAHQRGPRWYTVLRALRSWAIAPRTPGRC